jgi:hypothetical protein
MVVENPNQQSATGQLASGYLKATGYVNMVGVIIIYITGGIFIFIGFLLGFLFGSFFVLLTFAGIGLVMILIGKFVSRHSKKMREGRYYQVGTGWVEPQ